MDNATVKFWMIVKLYDGIWPLGNKLCLGDRPKYMHADKEAAEIELLRLAKRFLDSEFFLLESVASTSWNLGYEYVRVEPNSERPLPE